MRVNRHVYAQALVLGVFLLSRTDGGVQAPSLLVEHVCRHIQTWEVCAQNMELYRKPEVIYIYVCVYIYTNSFVYM